MLNILNFVIEFSQLLLAVGTYLPAVAALWFWFTGKLPAILAMIIIGVACHFGGFQFGIINAQEAYKQEQALAAERAKAADIALKLQAKQIEERDARLAQEREERALELEEALNRESENEVGKACGCINTIIPDSVLSHIE